jgi:uncharacterized SAM-binding protein YcdF (DUF218 family)
MVYVLSKLLWMALRPSVFLVLLSACGLGLLYGRHARLGRRLVAAGVGGLLAALLLPLEVWLARPLEDRFPPVLEPPAQVDGVVMLGGALDTWVSTDRGLPTLNAEAERITAFVALARRYPSARLVFSGGNADGFQAQLSEASVVRMLMDQLGVPADRVSYEGASRNTWENAANTKTLVGPRPGETWVLLTSAAHMPRSVGIFRQVGWPVLPWPVAYKTAHQRHLMGSADFGERLAELDFAVHEWVGLVAYHLMGRTEAWLPGP